MAEFEGKQGRWITTKTGRHVFVEKGKTVKQALADTFEEYTYDNEKKYGIRGWTHTSIYDTEEQRKNAYRTYSDKDFDFELDYNKVFEILNNPNLSKEQTIRKIGDLFGEYAPGNNYELGAALFNKYFEDDYNQIIKERENAKFKSKIEAADKYLSGIDKIREKSIHEANNYSNYHNYKMVNREYAHIEVQAGWIGDEYRSDWQVKVIDNRDKYDEYTNNCQRCVMAWWLRYQGYNVEAMPWDGENGKSNKILKQNTPRIGTNTGSHKDWTYAGFNIPHGTVFDYSGKDGERSATQFKNINEMVKQSKNGSVFFCSVSWRHTKSGHVFIVHNDNGNVRFIDPQDNSDASVYFSQKNKSGQSKIVPAETTLLRVNDLTLNGDVLPQIVKECGFKDI